MNEWMVFADRIKKEMERQGLSYRQLADKMEMTTTTIFRYAKGQRIPRANEILKAANALGVTCDYLLGLADEPHITAAQAETHACDTISRQAALAETVHMELFGRDFPVVPVGVLKALPPAQPEREKGRWIEYIPEHGKCQFCGNQVDLLNGKANNFCGECGADMRGEQE